MTAATASPADRMQALVAEQLARNAWSREQLIAHQRERVCALIEHAREHSPYYREVLDPRADVGDMERLSKATLMEQWDRIVCDARLRRDEVAAHAASDRASEPYLGEYQVFTTNASPAQAPS
jgi:phenylacetate-CoA ligase